MARDQGSLFGGPTRAEFRVGIVLGLALLLAAWHAMEREPEVVAAPPGRGASESPSPEGTPPAASDDDADEEPATPPRLYRVIVPVPDLERAAAWYGELLGVPGERISGGRHYLDCGGTILALYQPSGDGDEDAARPLPDHLYFAVPDLEAVFARAESLGGLSAETGDGDLPMGAIAVRPWGERSFYTSDPWGTRLCFVDEETVFTGW